MPTINGVYMNNCNLLNGQNTESGAKKIVDPLFLYFKLLSISCLQSN